MDGAVGFICGAWGDNGASYGNPGALACVTDSATGRTTTYYYDFTDRLMKYVETGSGYSHSARYEYDTINNLTRLVETINGVTHTTSYAYDMDNRVTQITTDGVTKAYTYDAYGRVSRQVTTSGGAAVLVETYTYTTASNGQPTAQVATYRTQSALYDVTYAFTYDDNGNILSVSDGTNTTFYAYDSANQLIRENNQAANKTYTWAYDNAGNILSKSTYAYTTGELGSVSSFTEYTYGDSAWGDLLTEYGGSTITYDAIGNPTRDYAYNTYTWKHGRQLATYKEDGNESEDIFHFVYNADGLRVKVYNAYTTYSYIYNGSALVQMEVSNTSTGAVSHALSFTYDANGTPQTLTYNGTTYFYATNLQGDVVAILDNTGTAVVEYTYNAWGKPLSVTGSLASTLGKANPLRYRGYVYDIESELYYLQSRYYNPETGRFINADSLTSTGQGVLGNNMFAYCNNNPTNLQDSEGNLPKWLKKAAKAIVTVATVVIVTSVAVAAACVAAPAVATALGVTLASTAALAATATAAMTVATVTAGAAAITLVGIVEVATIIESKRNVDAKDLLDDDCDDSKDNDYSNRKKVGKPKGKTPGNNQRQNRSFDDATTGLTKKQKRLVHDRITSRGDGYHDIVDLVDDLFRQK